MKKILPIIIAVVVVGLAVGGWFLFGKDGREVEKVSVPSGIGVEAPLEEKGFTGKLKDALLLGKSMKCTWKRDEGNFGTAYIKGDKVYSDVTHVGQRVYSIMADDCIYSWQEGKTEGFKMCFEPEEVEKEVEKGTPNAERFFGEMSDIDYNCVIAVVSDTKFKPPTNINFASPEKMMRQFIPTP